MSDMSFWEEVTNLFRDRNIQSLVLFCHANADPDALSSAHTLRNLFLEVFPSLKRVRIVAEDLNEVSKRITETYSDIVVDHELTFEPDVFIIVDSNNIDHLGRFSEEVRRSKNPIIVVDHHVLHQSSDKSPLIVLVDEKASSTAELVCALYKSAGRKPTSQDATILLTGIIYDSRRFSTVGRDAFHAVAFLVDAGGDYSSALSVLREPIERPEKLARLKAAQRLRIVEINGWVVAISNVSSFEASACRALIELGADVALVGSKKKTCQRVSARSRSDFYDKTGVSLALLMERIGVELGGSGGGHATAATVNDIDDIEKGEALILRYMDEEMRQAKEKSVKQTR